MEMQIFPANISLQFHILHANIGTTSHNFIIIIIHSLYDLCDEYYRLDKELKNLEALKRSAENIMRDEPEREQPTRTKGMEIG